MSITEKQLQIVVSIDEEVNRIFKKWRDDELIDTEGTAKLGISYKYAFLLLLQEVPL
jgi:hypothetical protein